MEKYFAELSRTNIFNGLNEELITSLLNDKPYRMRKVVKDEYVAYSHDVCKDMLIVVQGSVRGEMADFSGKRLKIEDIEAPRPLAAAFIFGHDNRFPVDIIANEASVILIIPRDVLIFLLQNSEVILKNYLNTISSRAQFLSGKIRFLSFKTIREKALRKKYTRLQWQYISEFYRLPKIIMTIAISLTIYSIIRMSGDITLLSLIFLAIYAMLLLIYFLFFYKHKSRIELTTGKSFLQIEYLNSIRGTLMSVGFLPINLLVLNSFVIREFHLSLTGISLLELLTSFLITFFAYSMVAMFSYIPKRVKEDFIRQFPQFVKS